MEQNVPVSSKKVWSLVRAILFMIKKSISKRKLMLDLNMMMKRGKIARKALQNLMFNMSPQQPEDHYEFSCRNTPVHIYPLSLFTSHKKHPYNNKNKSHKKQPIIINNQHDQLFVDSAVTKALEMLTITSPAIHVFGKSPMVRQLRITDSPLFPLNNAEDDSYVDEAAEKFIMKFYNDLRREN